MRNISAMSAWMITLLAATSLQATEFRRLPLNQFNQDDIYVEMTFLRAQALRQITKEDPHAKPQRKKGGR